MKQYRITSIDTTPQSEDDCMLDANDPIHEMKAVAMFGGLGAEEALLNYNSLNKPVVVGSNKGQIQREQNIKPGTDAWFKLWFGQQK